MPSPPEPKAYKGNDYRAYYNFCRQLDQYIEQKPKAFPTEERKITYGQMRLDGPIAASWTLHRSTLNIEEYTLEEFKEYLLNEIAPWGNRMRDAMTGLLTYSGRNDSATRIMEKAQELAMIMGSKDEPFWANWMIAKAPPSVAYSLAQQGISITSLGEAKARIEMITQASQSSRDSNPPQKPSSTLVGSKRPASEDHSNPRPSKQASTQQNATNREKQQKEGRCFQCNETGHLSRNCPRKSQSDSQPKNPP